MSQPSAPFTLASVEAALSARLGLKPFRRGTRTKENLYSKTPVVEYVELVYGEIALSKIKAAVAGLKTVQPVGKVPDAFFSESGHWVNPHPAAPFQLKMRRYRGDNPSVRFTVVPLAQEIVKQPRRLVKPAPVVAAKPGPLVIQDWSLRPMGCEFTSSPNRHWFSRSIQFA